MKLLKINHPSKFTLTEKLVVKIKAVSLSDDGKTLEILSDCKTFRLDFKTRARAEAWHGRVVRFMESVGDEGMPGTFTRYLPCISNEDFVHVCKAMANQSPETESSLEILEEQ